ncbi:MAG TPA: Maf family protein [Vicinamibacterales bacterium]|nr:Maf family protein [Vicinamibacterales bacterium]
MRLVLASASPRRADLLRAAGYDFDVLSVDLDERVHAGETPAAYVARLAREKSAAAMQRFAARAQTCGGPERAAVHDVIVLGADTTVVVDGEILGKPADDGDGARMLRKLSGRAHEVLTGISLRTSTAEWGRIETTRVYMTALTDDDVRWYVGSGEGRDKAGGYAVQGLASRFIPRIDGSYANVVGLPVEAVAAVLREVVSKG